MAPVLEASPPSTVHAALRSAVTGAPDVRSASRAVVDHLSRQGLLPSVYLKQGDRLRCQAVRGYWQVTDGMAPGTGLIGRCFRTNEPIVEPDVSRSADYLQSVEGVTAEVCVPVRVGGEAVGVLNVESVAPLGRGALPEVSRCAALLGERLEQAGPLDVPSPAQSLARIGARLAALSEPDAILAETVQAARELSGLSSALLVLSEPEQRRFAVGPLAPSFGRLSSATLAGMASWVESGSSVYTIGERAGRRFAGHDPLRRAGGSALALVPLVAGGQRLGLLVIADQRPVRLAPDIVELLELLAIQAASALGTALAVRELRRRAEQDSLTGLGHHATFHADLGLRRREAVDPLAVVLVDVDHFKAVNDARGHATGDAILRDVAAILGETPAARAYRIGGDEFALIASIDDGGEPAAHALGERVCAAVRERFEGVTVSVGAALPEAGESDSDLLARADAALYAAKAAGRDRAVTA